MRWKIYFFNNMSFSENYKYKNLLHTFKQK